MNEPLVKYLTYISVLLDGVYFTELFQFLNPRRQLLQLPRDPFRLLLQVVLELGLAVLNNLRVLRPVQCKNFLRHSFAEHSKTKLQKKLFGQWIATQF